MGCKQRTDQSRLLCGDIVLEGLLKTSLLVTGTAVDVPETLLGYDRGVMQLEKCVDKGKSPSNPGEAAEIPDVGTPLDATLAVAEDLFE